MSLRTALAASFGAVVLGMGLVGLETLIDPEPFRVLEFVLDAVEKSLLFVGVGGVAWLFVQLRAEHRHNQSLSRELDQARADGAQWRARVHVHVSGLGQEIGQQFAEWGLTQAECDVALAVLKGLTHKGIAVLRGTSEATVRQQAQSIYQKSKIPGKAAFSAYFLEDLLPPAALVKGQLGDTPGVEVER